MTAARNRSCVTHAASCFEFKLTNREFQPIVKWKFLFDVIWISCFKWICNLCVKEYWIEKCFRLPMFIFCVCVNRNLRMHPVEWIRFFLHNPQNPLLRRSANGVQFMLADSVDFGRYFQSIPLHPWCPDGWHGVRNWQLIFLQLDQSDVHHENGRYDKFDQSMQFKLNMV